MRGCEVTLLTRAHETQDSNTLWAQGGIIYRGHDERPEQLVADILSAGAGLSSPEAASLLSHEGPRLVKQILIDELQVPFDPSPENPGELDLTSEAGHSIPRIIHFKDRTGYSIERVFSERVQAHPKVKVIANATAVDLLTASHHSVEPTDVYRPLELRGRIRARPDYGQNFFHSRQGNNSGDGRAWQRIPAHDESSRRARRRHRHGLSRRGALH